MAAISPEDQHPVKAYGWAARDTSGVLSPFKFSRRATGEKDVRFKVLYCGICHTDLVLAKNEWGISPYPLVPGHEFTGEVTEVGSKVTKFKVGDRIGVGCFCGSCGSCEDCQNHLENYCPKGILTYPGIYHDGTPCYGGYSNEMVITENFGVHIPESIALDASAPLLCAGITVYSPMKYYGICKPGQHIGIVGIGGLGHVAIKFAKAFGMKVTAISTSDRKREEALKHLGADEFLVSKDPEQMKAAMGTMDGILDTVSASHDVMPLIALLKNHGKFMLVGAPSKPIEIAAFPMHMGRKMVGGSGAGGIKETQEMIDFAAKHGIIPDIEVVAMDYVNTAYERLEKGDVKYRFVIDIGNTLKAE